MTLAQIQLLVVDDVNALRFTIRKALLDMGFKKIDEAKNGEEARKFIFTNPPIYHLIICDLQMSGLSGLDILKRLKTTDSTKNIPFVLLARNDSNGGDIQMAKDLNVDDCILKPFELEQFKTRIIQLLAKKGILDP